MKKILPRQVRVYFFYLFAAGIVLGAIGAGCEIKALYAIGGILMIGAIIFRVIFYRCPHCGKYLDRSDGDFCPGCGREVNE